MDVFDYTTLSLKRILFIDILVTSMISFYFN